MTEGRRTTRALGPGTGSIEPGLAVIALGGNAILQPGQVGTFEEQLVNIDGAAQRIARLILAGWRVVVTHGNGPQVGNFLIQNEAASAQVPPMPMDACGAESQGRMGYMLAQSLTNNLRRLQSSVPVCGLLTQVEVAADDPAFTRPSKPVGPFCSEIRAKEFSLEKGFTMREDAGRGWRRVVPSPDPRAIVESEVIADLVANGVLVGCSGGGGVPVVRDEIGNLSGAEAVIDRDLVAARLAADVAADALLILTDVEKVYLDYKTPRQRALDSVPAAEMASRGRRSLQGQLHGTQGRGLPALRPRRWRRMVANLLDVEQAPRGETGTRIEVEVGAARQSAGPTSALRVSATSSGQTEPSETRAPRRVAPCRRDP